MEIRVDFESQEEWNSWHSEHAGSFMSWQEAIASSVQSHGYVEPLTGIRIDASRVRIDRDNYRESLACNGLNSRKRALLLEFDLLTQNCAQFNSRKLRIFAPEALSRTAMILRGIYPYFLGTEYIPDERRRLRYYPIQHADLTALDMPDVIYDAVVVSDDALENVTTLSCAIEGIARVLRPDGALIATCRFASQSAESVSQTKIVRANPPPHQVAGDFAGDLDQPAEATFQVPGWDILDMCRRAGLHDARMVLHASSTHGIVGDSAPGVFVLSAIKSDNPDSRPRRDWLWNSRHINRVVGLLGIPRSGTTMFAAVLDAHSDIVCIYEPWNAQRPIAATDRTAITAASLTDEAERQDPRASTLLIKETGLDPAYAENLAGVLAQALPPLDRHLFFLLRNPFHCFLSEVEGRRKWWGEAELEVNATLFDRWASRSLASFSQMARLSERFPSAFVFYEACVSDPVPTFTKVMRLLGLDFDQQQLRITETTDVSRIRGDLSLVENARDVADESISKRDQELELVAEKFSGSAAFDRVKRVADCFVAFESQGVIGSDHPDRDAFLSAVRNAIRDSTL